MAAAQKPQSPDAREEAARRGGTWTEEEKARGAGAGEDAGAAGEAAPKGRPTDDREETEAAAANIQEAAPDPDTPVGGGQGTRSTGGSATDPGSDPKAPRNPA